jgi:DNA-binding LacI/PurR family transcriptional regulator
MVTLHHQAKTHILAGIRSGQFPLQRPLPPVDAIAAMTGCSTDTVRRALRDLARDGILRNANRGGTVVMRMPALGHVLLLLSPDAHTNLLFQEPIAQACLTAGYEVDILLGDVGNDATYDRLERALSAAPATTTLVVLAPHWHKEHALERLCAAANKAPTRLYIESEGIPAELPTGMQIEFDWAAAAKALVLYLRDLGHRRVAVFSGIVPTETTSLISRTAHLFEQMCEIAGLQCLPYYWISAQGPFAEFVRRHGITAYWDVTDHRAIQTFGELLEAGIRVPDECSLIGRNDTPWSREGRMALTTLSLNPAGVAASVVATLQASEAGTPMRTQYAVAPQLIVRGSSGPAPTP